MPVTKHIAHITHTHTYICISTHTVNNSAIGTLFHNVNLTQLSSFVMLRPLSSSWDAFCDSNLSREKTRLGMMISVTQQLHPLHMWFFFLRLRLESCRCLFNSRWDIEQRLDLSRWALFTLQIGIRSKEDETKPQRGTKVKFWLRHLRNIHTVPCSTTATNWFIQQIRLVTFKPRNTVAGQISIWGKKLELSNINQ